MGMDPIEAIQTALFELRQRGWVDDSSTAVVHAHPDIVTQLRDGALGVAHQPGSSDTVLGCPLFEAPTLPEGRVLVVDRDAIVPRGQGLRDPGAIEIVEVE